MTADTALRRVNERHGTHFTLEGPCAGGEIGAYFVQDREQRLVFKWSENPEREHRLHRLVKVLNQLHGEGYPLPKYGPVLAFDGGVFIGQEAVRGRWSDQVDDDLLNQLLRWHAFQQGRGEMIDAESWGNFILRTLRHGGDGWALHEPLRAHSTETRRVVDWIEKIGRNCDESAFRETDLVHIDFHHRNALQDENGSLAALIDWEDARQGDAAFDLVTLAFGLAIANCSAEGAERVWSAAANESGEVLPAYVAHMVLRRLDWTIRFHSDEVPFWLDVCRGFIGRLAT